MSGEYRVRWEIDIFADSPEEAVKEAVAIQRDSESIANCFEVQHRLYVAEHDGRVHEWGTD